MSITREQLLLGHDSEDTAYVVDDYPYGRSRTQKRYWIESRAGHGDRLCTQTLNPRTGRWNKPKKGTYSTVLVLYLQPQEDGRLFVKAHGLGLWKTNEDVDKFLALVGAPNLNEIQRASLAAVVGMNRVMEHVTWTVKEGEQTPEEKAEQAAITGRVNQAIKGATVVAYREISGS